MPFGSYKRVLIPPSVWVAGLIVLLAGGVAHGALVTIGITGNVTFVADPAGVLDGQINAGYIITGSYMYDSSTTDTNPSSAIGDYQFNTSPFGISLNIGGLLFASNPADVDFLIKVSNDYNSKDSFLLSSANNLPLPIGGGVTVAPIRWQLEDDTGTALNNDALPLTAPMLEDWQSVNALSITCRSSAGGARIEGTITDAYLIPEPASAVVLSLGSLFIGLRRKRR
jgi:hypothetical protein